MVGRAGISHRLARMSRHPNLSSFSHFFALQQLWHNISFFYTNLFRGFSPLLLYCAADYSRNLLLLAGDVERNPGPISRDAKPVMRDLQCMPYTNEEGKSVYFRLTDRIKPRLNKVAIALDFPPHFIEVLKTESDPECYLLTEWLQGRDLNPSESASQLTWGTLITALKHAGLMEEVRILEQHFLADAISQEMPASMKHEEHSTQLAGTQFAEIKKELKEIKEKLTTLEVPPKSQSIPVTVGGVKLEQVVDELKEIADDWKLLGSHLVLAEHLHVLKEIELQKKSPVECLELVIFHWKESSPDGNWMDIVAALKKIEKSKLADLLQQKYATKESPSKPEDPMSQVCSEEHLAQIAIWIIDWRRVSPFLGLTDADEQAILESEDISVPNQKVAMLRKWKQKLGSKATYKRLCRAFRNCGLDHLQGMVKMQFFIESHGLDEVEDIRTSGASAATAKPATTEKIWQLRGSTDADFILSGRPNGTYLVWEKSGHPPIDSSSLSINTHYISVVVQGKVDYVLVYKKGYYYGFLNHEEFHSVEDLILQLTVYGFTIARTTQVRLIHRLLPDKDVLAKLPKDIPQPRIAKIRANDVATVSKDYPHHNDRTWLCEDFTKKKSEKVLRGKQDETFLVRATDLSGPNHVFNVDIVLRSKIITQRVTRIGNWLQLENYGQLHDSIKTLVLYNATKSNPYNIGGQVVNINLRHPVYASYWK